MDNSNYSYDFYGWDNDRIYKFYNSNIDSNIENRNFWNRFEYPNQYSTTNIDPMYDPNIIDLDESEYKIED